MENKNIETIAGNRDYINGFEDACILIGNINIKKQGKELGEEIHYMVACMQEKRIDQVKQDLGIIS